MTKKKTKDEIDFMKYRIKWYTRLVLALFVVYVIVMSFVSPSNELLIAGAIVFVVFYLLSNIHWLWAQLFQMRGANKNKLEILLELILSLFMAYVFFMSFFAPNNMLLIFGAIAFILLYVIWYGSAVLEGIKTS
jgi:hypothetical protein